MNSKVLLFTVLALTTMPFCAIKASYKKKSKSKSKNWVKVLGSRRQKKLQSGSKNWEKVLGSCQKEKGRSGGRNNKRSEKRRKERYKNNPFLKKAEGDELEYFDSQDIIYYRIEAHDGENGYISCLIYRPDSESPLAKLVKKYKKKNVHIPEKILNDELKVPLAYRYLKKNNHKKVDYALSLFLCDKKTNKKRHLLYCIREVKGGFFSEPLQAGQSQSLQIKQIE